MSYYDDPGDEEMLHLKFYLECLSDCDDVRLKNRDAFQLSQLADAQVEKLKQIRTPSNEVISPESDARLEI